MPFVESLREWLKVGRSVSRFAARRIVRPNKVVLSIPGWVSVEMEPNVAEQRAAWALYVEISTRVASRRFDRQAGSIRSALTSLYSLFEFTRSILRTAGPDIAYSPTSLGPLAIRFLTEIVAPFTTRWNEALAMHEALIVPSETKLNHERKWQLFEECCDDLDELRLKVLAYQEALKALCFVNEALVEETEERSPIASERGGGAA